jgi:hypothetical protein
MHAALLATHARSIARNMQRSRSYPMTDAGDMKLRHEGMKLRCPSTKTHIHLQPRTTWPLAQSQGRIAEHLSARRIQVCFEPATACGSACSQRKKHAAVTQLLNLCRAAITPAARPFQARCVTQSPEVSMLSETRWQAHRNMHATADA